jgi:glycosidase
MKRLKFFDKDSIEWTGIDDLHGFFRAMLMLKKRNPAMRAGDPSVTTHRLHTKLDDHLFVFARRAGDDQVIVLLNFSGENLTLPVSELLIQGPHREVFSGIWMDLSLAPLLQFLPWGYMVLEKV